MAMPAHYDPARVEQYINELFLGQTSMLDVKVNEAKEAIEVQLSQAGTLLRQCQEAGQQCVNQITILTANAKDSDNRMKDRIEEVNLLKTAIEGEHGRVQGEISQIHQDVMHRDGEMRGTIHLVEQEVEAEAASNRIEAGRVEEEAHREVRDLAG